MIGAYLGTINFLSGQTALPRFANPAMSFLVYVIGAWLLLFLWPTLFVAPYRIWRANKERIEELEKIGSEDLERMLGGKYISNNTFLYGGDVGRVCARWESKGEIELLRDCVTAIAVPAPKGSIAHIRFEFRHSRNNGKERCHFYTFRDGQAVEIENIYEHQLIPVGHDGCFQLKLTWSDSYTLGDGAFLQIGMDGWTK